jgi:dTDP-glucose 4,6-dehydratase/UDP-glucuronate decarboxylase
MREDVGTVARAMGDVLSPLTGSTLLITGGNGFLCSYVLDLIAYLNDSVFTTPCRVISVDNLITGTSNRTAHLACRTDFRFITHDVSKPLSLSEKKIDWIIHGASIASPVSYRRFPLATIDVNVAGTRHMLDLARDNGVRSMLYLSTSEIYGDPDPRFVPTAEDYHGNVSSTGPRACYDESKRLAETLCAVYFRSFGLPVKMVRPFNVYGPGQRLDDGRIIPDLITAALDRRPIILYSDGRASRSFCYVTDALEELLRVLLSQANGEVFNIGNDQQEINIRNLAAVVRDVAGPPELKIEHRQSQDADFVTHNPQRRCPDLTRIRTLFAWKPQVGLADGLRRTLTSYRELREQERRTEPDGHRTVRDEAIGRS